MAESFNENFKAGESAIYASVKLYLKNVEPTDRNSTDDKEKMTDYWYDDPESGRCRGSHKHAKQEHANYITLRFIRGNGSDNTDVRHLLVDFQPEEYERLLISHTYGRITSGMPITLVPAVQVRKWLQEHQAELDKLKSDQPIEETTYTFRYHDALMLKIPMSELSDVRKCSNYFTADQEEQSLSDSNIDINQFTQDLDALCKKYSIVLSGKSISGMLHAFPAKSPNCILQRADEDQFYISCTCEARIRN